MFQQAIELSEMRTGNATVVPVALDIDPLALRVVVNGETHRFSDRAAMERFLDSLWERALVA